MTYTYSDSLRARRLPAVSAVAVIATVVVAGLAGGFNNDDNHGAGNSTPQTVVTPPPTNVETTASSPTPTPIGDDPTAPGAFAAVPAAARTTLSSSITRDSAGPEVLRLQERLLELKFDPGPLDGEYGSYTVQALWAFQKLILGVPRDQVTATVTDELWQRIQDEVHVTPRRPAGHPSRTSENHTEIYLPEQVVVFFQSDVPVLIAHTSSGDSETVWRETVTIDPGQQYNENGTEPIERGYMALSHTPGGVFKYDRFRTGLHQSALGGMWDPAYFNFGIAIHGARTVPTYPASHGCIRMNLHLGRIFQQYVAKGDQVFVWNLAGDQPEDAPNDYPWNQLDPDNPVNSTTTTTTTTTTPPATTAAPTTTQAPATSPPPPTPTPTPAPTTTTTVASTTTTPTEPAEPPATEPPPPEDDSSV